MTATLLKLIGVRNIIMVTIAIAMLSYLFFLRKNIITTEEENKQYKEAIVAYEALIKTVKFETKIKQNKEHTDEKILHILNNHATVMDGDYSL